VYATLDFMQLNRNPINGKHTFMDNSSKAHKIEMMAHDITKKG
jgi:hypothetical protein